MATDTHVGVGIAISIVIAGACTSCIAAGTPVATPSGPIAIEELIVGQSVWAWSIAERRRVVREITAVHGGRGGEQLLLELENGRSIGITGSHPVWCPQRSRWRPAREVQAGDAVWAVDESGRGRSLGVTSVGTVQAEDHSVHNLSVAGEENFFAAGVLVHNKSIWKDDSGLTDSGGADTGMDALDAQSNRTRSEPVPPAPERGVTALVEVSVRMEGSEHPLRPGHTSMVSSVDGPLTLESWHMDRDGQWRGQVRLSPGMHTLRLAFEDEVGHVVTRDIATDIDENGA